MCSLHDSIHFYFMNLLLPCNLQMNMKAQLMIISIKEVISTTTISSRSFKCRCFNVIINRMCIILLVIIGLWVLIGGLAGALIIVVIATWICYRKRKEQSLSARGKGSFSAKLFNLPKNKASLLIVFFLFYRIGFLQEFRLSEDFNQRTLFSNKLFQCI